MEKETAFKFLVEQTGTKYIDIANELDVTRQMVNIWAKGSRKIADKYISTISEMLGVPERYLREGLTDREKLQFRKQQLIKECKKLNILFEEL